MKLRIHPKATAEAGEAAARYDGERTGLGDEFLAELDGGTEYIERSADALPAYEYSPLGRNVRWYKLNRFPYLVYFEVFRMSLSSGQ